MIKSSGKFFHDYTKRAFYAQTRTRYISFRLSLRRFLEWLRRTVVGMIFCVMFCRVCNGKVINSAHRSRNKSSWGQLRATDWKVFRTSMMWTKIIVQRAENSVNAEARMTMHCPGHCCLIKNISAPGDLFFICKLTKSPEHVWSWIRQKRALHR